MWVRSADLKANVVSYLKCVYIVPFCNEAVSCYSYAIFTRPIVLRFPLQFKLTCKNLMLERDNYSLELGDVCTPNITMHNVSSQIWSPSSEMRLSCRLGMAFDGGRGKLKSDLFFIFLLVSLIAQSWDFSSEG